jgi:hypothetical protein
MPLNTYHLHNVGLDVFDLLSLSKGERTSKLSKINEPRITIDHFAMRFAAIIANVFSELRKKTERILRPREGNYLGRPRNIILRLYMPTSKRLIMVSPNLLYFTNGLN